jgi:DNA-binding MarR family transcriptional regulator
MDEQQPDPGAAPVPTLASTLAEQLRGLFGRLHRRLREEADPGDFTPSQIAALVRLEREGPATVTTLARAEAMRPQSMGATVSALEAAGLLVGTPDPADGRQTLWSVTTACREMILAGRAARQDWLARTIRTRLTPEEQEDVARAVALINRLVEP